MSSEIDEMGEGLMRSAAVVEGLRRRKKTTPNETFEAPNMPSTVPGISIDVLNALDKSPTATPAPSRINSEPSSPVGGPDNLRTEAVLKGHYPSPTATPYNTRAGSPERGVNIRPHTAGQAVETMAKLEELAVGRM